MATPRIYGIDLGTTYSCIAYVDEYGKPVILPNSDGQSTTPSVVFFESSTNIVVGKHAKDVAVQYAERVVSRVKREMSNPEYGHLHDGQLYKPQTISALILQKLVADAESVTGEKVTDVVITCPAYFGVNEREATREAGILAGLKVHYVIPEPVAAALAYGINQSEEQVILVYDLGGGTFDVTVIEVKSDAITVICTGGDHQLGGKDWDERVAEWAAQQFQQATGIPADGIRDNKETWQVLLKFAEEAKMALSARINYVQRISHEGASANLELTREIFDALTEDLLQTTLSLTETLLETAQKKGYSKIDKILLVGGSTYMPQVLKAVPARFPYEVKQFDPNQAVAKGAALFGFKCSLEEQVRIRIAESTGGNAEDVNLATTPESVRTQAQLEVATTNGIPLPAMLSMTQRMVTNVASKSFGIVVHDEKLGGDGICNLIVVNQPLPCSSTRHFFTQEDSTSVQLTCMENSNTNGAEDPAIPMKEASAELGMTLLTFARLLPKGSPIEVHFALTPDGLLTLHGKDLTTQKEVTGELRTSACLNQEELERGRIHITSLTVS